LSGWGGGPLFIGLVSDALKLTHGADSLRWALLALVPIALAAAAAQFAMARHLEGDFTA